MFCPFLLAAIFPTQGNFTPPRFLYCNSCHFDTMSFFSETNHKLPAWVATGVLIPVVIIFALFAVHFYRTLAEHKYTIVQGAVTELDEIMARNGGKAPRRNKTQLRIVQIHRVCAKEIANSFAFNSWSFITRRYGASDTLQHMWILWNRNAERGPSIARNCLLWVIFDHRFRLHLSPTL